MAATPLPFFVSVSYSFPSKLGAEYEDSKRAAEPEGPTAPLIPARGIVGTEGVFRYQP